MTIEALCKAYPDVPRTILIKTDTIRIGLRFSMAAQEVLKGADIHFKGYFIFSSDQGEHETTHSQRIPRVFCLKSDDTIVETRINPNSSYVIDWKEDKFVLCDESGQVEEIYFLPAPKWLNQVLDDGTPMQALVQPLGRDKVGACLDYYCEYWTTKEQCLFCDIVGHLRFKKEKETKTIARQNPERLAKAIADAMKDVGFRHLALSAGTIVKERDGKSETEWFCEYLNAINQELRGQMWSSYFQIGAKKKDEIKMLYDTGIFSLHHNMEVWDERLFKIICPGKARVIGREELIKRIIEAVEVFGRGRILSNFVSGVEMAQPWGFKDPAEAVKSTLSGFEYLMSHDVLPRMDMWCVEPNSALKGQQPPPLEYYIELDRGYLELRQKYDFPFPLSAYCRGCTLINLSADWDYYFWGKG